MVVPRRVQRKVGGNSSRDSQRVVLALLILVLVVSLISLILYFEALQNIEQMKTARSKVLVNGGKASGEVAITISTSPEEASLASQNGENDEKTGGAA